MSLTKKHFEGIASAINKADCSNPEYTRLFICENLADYFKSQNAQFDREKFIKACGFNCIEELKVFITYGAKND